MKLNNPCTLCGEPGIPGLIKGAGKCQYHWNAGQFGAEWADEVKRRNTMSTIFKHTLFPGRTVLLLPKNAQVLTVQDQYGDPQLWVRCNPAAPTEARIFEIMTTGQTTIDDPRDCYVGTFQSHGGAFVGHVFEVFP